MEQGIGYEVRLKYVKKIQLPVVREQRLAEFVPVFEANGKKESLGKAEVHTRVFLPEFLRFAKNLGFWVREPEQQTLSLEGVSGFARRTKLFSNDDYAYLRLLIYGVVMSVLKKPSDWGKLEDHLVTMEPIPLRYWASKFRNAYWKYKNRKKLRFLARRFLEVEWNS